jgi:rhodanese-related sulfurtransferase
MKRTIVLVIVVLAVFLPACQAATQLTASNSTVVGTTVSTTGSPYTNVSVAELQAMLANKDFLLVNVHIPFEGNIQGTDSSIPYDQIAQNLDQLTDKSARIVLYCRSGRMSAIAAETLVGLGYTNIFNLDGGMSAWEAAGLEIQH